jgi:hypothetical protein
MNSANRGASLAISALLLGACSERTGNDSAEHIARRDSAGVAIVETSVSLADANLPWTLDTVPELSIGAVGGNDPNYQLTSVVGLMRLPNGSIVVADNGSVKLRFYSAEGKFVKESGGIGEGPGETGTFSEVRGCGEDLIVVRDRSRRNHWWNASGNYRGPAKISLPVETRFASSGNPPLYWACSANGDMLMTSWGDETKEPSARDLKPGSAQAYKTWSKIWLLDSAAKVVLELPDTIIAERIVHMSATGGGGSGPHPLGRAIAFALDNEQLYVSFGDRAEVSVFSRDGRLLRLMRAPVEDLTLTPAMLERYLKGQLSPADAEDRDYFFGRYEIAMPATYPVFDKMFRTHGGIIWVRRFRLPWEAETSWGVFAPDGAFLGYTRLPAGLEVFEIGDDYILGVKRDDLDVPFVQLYRMRRD